MATLIDLLKYKRELEIKDSAGNVLATIWMRVLGDHDIQEAYRLGRIASAKKRAILRDSESDDYIDEIAVFDEASKEECIETILFAKGNNFNAEAVSANSREELPTLREIAVDPDAPTLEEQEQIELEKVEREVNYQKRLEDFVETRKLQVRTELEATDLNTLRSIAKEEAINIISLTAFLSVLNEQKIFRAVYEDEKCTQKAFKTIEDFKNLHPSVKEQLIEAYSTLELTPDQIKN